jgi:hypothetical protein
MSDVFISHATKDKVEAEAIQATLIARGITVWIATKDTAIGSTFVLEILKNLRGARLMILILSAAAEASKYVLRELQTAFDEDKLILPFQIEDLPPSGVLKFFLGPIQILDARSGSRDQQLLKLIKRVEELLSSESQMTEANHLLSTPRDDETSLRNWLTPHPRERENSKRDGEDAFRANSIWKGMIRQDDRLFMATLVVISRDLNKVSGRLEWTVDESGEARRLSFAGKILEGTYLAFITDKLEGRVTFPGLYFGKLEGRTFSGTWQVPGWAQFDAFHFERFS